MVLLLFWSSGCSCTLLGPSTRTIWFWIWNQDFAFILIDHLSMHLGVWYICVEELAVILRSEVHLAMLIVRMMYIVFSLTIEVRRVETSCALALLVT